MRRDRWSRSPCGLLDADQLRSLVAKLQFIDRMYSTWIAVVDSSRGRLFRYERSVDPEGRHDSFVETEDFEPGKKSHAPVVVAPNKHREHGTEHSEVELARSIVHRLRDLGEPGHSLIVCAAPHMLGHIRAEAKAALRTDQQVTEVPGDFVHLSPTELRAHLTESHVLPSRA